MTKAFLYSRRHAEIADSQTQSLQLVTQLFLDHLHFVGIGTWAKIRVYPFADSVDAPMKQ
jgi:hypothetical protein